MAISVSLNRSVKTVFDMTPSEIEDILNHVPQDDPLPDEIEAFKYADASIALEGAVAYEDIDWGD